MQTVLAFAAKAVAGLGHAAAAGAHAIGIGSTAASAAAGTANVAAGAAKAASISSKILGAVRIGTSVVGALSVFQQQRMAADAAEREAFNQDLQASQEFIQSQERANAIQRDYNQTVQDQLAVAAASGIDIASGSVLTAREQAQAEADRQLTIDRQGTALNASLRRGRASALRSEASQYRLAGVLAGAEKIGTAVGQRKAID